MYKRLQEYNTSLQQYNSKLQAELASTNETLKRVEKEKASVVENLSTLRGHYNSMQDQLTSSRVGSFVYAFNELKFLLCGSDVVLMRDVTMGVGIFMWTILSGFSR